MLTVQTLRPGLLVSLTTSIKGNINYRTRDLASGATEGGGVRAVWETEKTIADAVEYEAATKVKSKVRALITGACIYSAHGLLCPEDGIENLEKAMREARQHVKEFNAKAKLTRVSFYSISGRIAADDVEAVKAINAELEGLLARMAQGVEQLDVKAIREAASKAKEVGGMLKPELQARIQIAVDVARSAAKQIVKAGETAALEIDRAAIRKIEESRTAFLDLDEAAEVKAPEATGRAIDMLPDNLDDSFGFNFSGVGTAAPATLDLD
jgi:hypothetical protein